MNYTTQEYIFETDGEIIKKFEGGSFLKKKSVIFNYGNAELKNCLDISSYIGPNYSYAKDKIYFSTIENISLENEKLKITTNQKNVYVINGFDKNTLKNMEYCFIQMKTFFQSEIELKQKLKISYDDFDIIGFKNSQLWYPGCDEENLYLLHTTLNFNSDACQKVKDIITIYTLPYKNIKNIYAYKEVKVIKNIFGNDEEKECQMIEILFNDNEKIILQKALNPNLTNNSLNVFKQYLSDKMIDGKPVIKKNTQSNNFSSNNLDELKKLKELLDMDAITQDEYNEMKVKLLNTNQSDIEISVEQPTNTTIGTSLNYTWDDNTNQKVSLLGLKSYQIIDTNTSASSAVARAGVGVIAFGAAGLAAGLSAKKKYQVMLFFEDCQKVVTMSDWYFKEFLNFVAEHNISSK